MEDLCHVYAKMNQLQIMNIRLANAAGYGETNPKLLGTIFMQMKKSSKYIELGNLTPKRDFIHIDDIAWAINQLSIDWPVELGSVETVNLGTGYEPLSVKEIFDKINSIYKNVYEIKVTDERKRKLIASYFVLIAPNFLNLSPNYKPKRVDDWLPSLVSDPNLRINNKLQKILDSKYGNQSKKYLLISPDFPPPLVGGSLVWLLNLIENSCENFDVLTGLKDQKYDEVLNYPHQVIRSRFIKDSHDPSKLQLLSTYIFMAMWLILNKKKKNYDAVLVNPGVVGNSILFLVGKILI